MDESQLLLKEREFVRLGVLERTFLSRSARDAAAMPGHLRSVVKEEGLILRMAPAPDAQSEGARENAAGMRAGRLVRLRRSR
jgi:uncharacterized caspase-like protein